jgi:hypothetical protein
METGDVRTKEVRERKNLRPERGQAALLAAKVSLTPL